MRKEHQKLAVCTLYIVRTMYNTYLPFEWSLYLHTYVLYNMSQASGLVDMFTRGGLFLNEGGGHSVPRSGNFGKN